MSEEQNTERLQVHERWVRSLAEEGATVPPSTAPAPRQPLWDEDSLHIAESIRTGSPHVVVDRPPDADVNDRAYVEYVSRLRRDYPSVTFMPADADAFQRGQATFKRDVAQHTERAAAAAAVGEIPLPIDGGQTLHAAIDEYVRWIRESKVKAGKLTSWGKVFAEQVRRLKESHADLPLSAVDYNVLEKIKTYWARRPKSKMYGKPIAVDTVRTQLGAARMFLKWLHKNPSWKWRKPEDWEDALKCELAGLMTDDDHRDRPPCRRTAIKKDASNLLAAPLLGALGQRPATCAFRSSAAAFRWRPRSPTCPT